MPKLPKPNQGKLNVGAQVSTKAEASSFNIIKGIFANAQLSNAFTEKIQPGLGWASLVAALLTLPFNIYKVVQGVGYSNADKPSRAMQVVWGGVGVALGVSAAIVIGGLITGAAPVVILAGSIKSVCEAGWNGVKTLYDRYVSKKGKEARKEMKHLEDEIKTAIRHNVEENQSPDLVWIDGDELKRLTALINQQRESNVKLANTGHSLAQALISTISAALLFTPLLPVGVIMLAAISAYGLLDASGDVVSLSKKIATGKDNDITFNPLKGAAKLVEKLMKKLGVPSLSDAYFNKIEPEDLLAAMTKEVMEKMQSISQIPLESPTSPTSSEPASSTTSIIMGELKIKPDESMATNTVKLRKSSTSSDGPPSNQQQEKIEKLNHHHTDPHPNKQKPPTFRV